MSLHPDDVGTRVVVRRVLPGETGPTGGPAATDTLGELTSWSPESVTVRREDGTEVVIDQADIVAAKTVPPRAARRKWAAEPSLLEVSPEDLEVVCSDGWRAPAEQQLGEWRLRAAGGFTGRANSALAVGDPGVALATALDRVVEFYGDHRLTPQAQVIVGSPQQAAIESRGWVRARPREPDAIVQVTTVSAALASPSATGLHPGGAPEVIVDLVPSRSWAARYERSTAYDPDLVRTILMSGNRVGFARIGSPEVAVGRGVIVDGWLGLSAVEVVPTDRRQGLGRAIVTGLLEWAAEHGARAAYLQTLPSNAAAIGLYSGFGFVGHHSYRYLCPPPA
jgi:ribosomal protein S18 acetylase RimI-like enzyme